MTFFNTEGEIEQAKKAPLADRILTDKSMVNALTRNGAMEKSKKPRWLTPSKLPKQPFLATHATEQYEDRKK
jgi:hypothetical protein